MRNRTLAFLIFIFMIIIVLFTIHITYKILDFYSDKPLVPHDFKRYIYNNIDFPVKKIKSRSKPEYHKFYNYYNVINSLYIYVTDSNEEAFLHDTGLKDVSFLRGFEKTSVFGMNDNSVFACVGKITNDTAIVAFRGTMTSIDWYEDFHYSQEELSNHIPGADGKVSTGFSGIYYTKFGLSKQGCYCDSKCGKSLFEKDPWCYTDSGCGNSSPTGYWDHCEPNNVTSIKMQLDKWRKEHPEVKHYIVTGHSLGAALATICAIDISDQLKEVYLFASPRVGNSNFANYYNKKLNDKTYEFNTDGDEVPSMPLSAMSDKECYKHVALPHYIIDYKLEDPTCKLSNIGKYHVSSAFISINALKQWKTQIDWADV